MRYEVLPTYKVNLLKNKMKTKHLIILFLAICLLKSNGFAQETSTSVFYIRGSRKWITLQDNQRALYKVISDEAFKQLGERAGHISGLATKADWENYQGKAKSALCVRLGNLKKHH